MLVCAREECSEVYKPKTHNQKYCGPECCRIETNRRIMEKYYAKKDQRAGKIRLCSSCGVTRLSRYNDSRICGSCELKDQENSRKSILGMINALSA